MSAEDYAILIGIGGYPQLGEGNTDLSLKGPGNDVEAMRDWLADPNGGAITDPSRIVTITSPGSAPPGGAEPTADRLEKALLDIDAMARGNGGRGGRRLYIFMSGHGYSPGRQRACLFAANAQERLSLNVHATGWLNWLQDSGYFREYVLWMDCCMNRLSFLPPRDPPLPLVNSLTPPGASFVAFAAQRPLRALEREFSEDHNKTHGVFTWTLLEGLRGAAADVNGRVTGRSVADWIRNALAAHMGDSPDDPDVAKEPEVVQEDSGLIFARGVPKRLYTVSLAFPAVADGMSARIWSGQPPAILKDVSIGAAPIEITVPPGLYLVEVPEAGMRHGFEVVCSTTVVVSDAGPPVTPAPEGRMFDLEVDPDDPNAEIFVIDGRFSMADSNPARLNAKLPFGLYKIKTRIGRATKQRVILLDRDRPPMDAVAAAPTPATIAPIDGTAATHEYHVSAANAAIDTLRSFGAAGHESGVLLMARTWSGREERQLDSHPWVGVSIVDGAGNTVVDLEHDGDRHETGDPYVICTSPLAAGSYYLRQRLDGGSTIEQSLVATKGWGLEVYILRRAGPRQSAVDSRPRVALTLRPLTGDRGSSPEEDKIIEVARTGLADERKVLNADLEELLFRRIGNPMARLVGGHLLLVEHDRDPGRDLSQLNAVVERLQRELGNDHPDVVALALMCPNPPSSPARRIVSPPLFQRSWKILVEASRGQRSKLVPIELWERVHAFAALPPFLVWSTNEAVKAESRRDLSRAIVGNVQKREIPGGPPGELAPVAMAQAMLRPSSARGAGAAISSSARVKAARDRAARLQVPASALDSLLKGQSEPDVEPLPQQAHRG